MHVFFFLLTELMLFVTFSICESYNPTEDLSPPVAAAAAVDAEALSVFNFASFDAIRFFSISATFPSRD